jgi:CcmD family protein
MLVVALLLPPAATAVGAGQPQQPPQAQDQFVPVKSLPGAQEKLPATPLVIGAYAFVWVVLLAFVWSVWRRQAKVEQELRNLERRVGR